MRSGGFPNVMSGSSASAFLQVVLNPPTFPFIVGTRNVHFLPKLYMLLLMYQRFKVRQNGLLTPDFIF